MNPDDRDEDRALPVAVTGPPARLLPTANEFAGMMQLANELAKTAGEMIPKGLNTPAKVVAAIEMARELGAPPLIGMNHLFIIDGKIAPDGQLMMGVVKASDPTADFVVETTREYCRVRLTRAGKTPVDLMYKISDVQAARVDKYGKLKWNWENYPDRMLLWHTVKAVCRLGAPDLLNVLNVAVPVQGESEPWPEAETRVVDAQVVESGPETPDPAEHAPEAVEAPRLGAQGLTREQARAVIWSAAQDAVGPIETWRPVCAVLGVESVERGWLGEAERMGISFGDATDIAVQALETFQREREAGQSTADAAAVVDAIGRLKRAGAELAEAEVGS